jgi:LysR family transcriptional regulator, regulator for metE and metH
MKPLHDPKIDVRALRLVAAIAGDGSVTRAAGKLHLSQSAVSHQLLALERDLDVRLFDRVGKRMVPTPAGARIAAAAEQLLAELIELERSLAHKPARVPLRVTTSCFTSYGWLPAALAHFGARNAEVELEIVLEATRRAVPALAADEVDLAICTDPPRDATYDRAVVAVSEIVAVASTAHPVATRARRGVLAWTALADCELLVHDIGDTDLARLTAAVQSPSPPAVRRIPLSEALLELVRAGRGVALVDRWTIAPHVRAPLRIFSMAPRAPRTFYAAWRRANPRQLPIDELVTVIQRAGARAVRAA